MAGGCALFLGAGIRAAADPTPSFAWTIRAAQLLVLAGLATFVTGLLRRKRT